MMNRVRRSRNRFGCRATVHPMRYRCNLGVWAVAGLMVLPFAVIWLLGPTMIALSEAFAL